MKGVRRHAVADHLGIDLRSTPLRVGVLLEDENPGPLAYHEPVAFPVPGTRSPRRIVIESRRERPCCGKAGETQPADRSLGTAAHHHIGVVEHDQPRRIADRMRSARASCDYSMVRTCEPVADGDMAGGKVDQIGRDEKRRQAAWAALVQSQCALGDARESAYPGTDHDAGALTGLLTVREPTGVLYRLSRRRQRKDDKSIHLALILGRYPIISIEQSRSGVSPRHLSGYLCRQVRYLEGLDSADPGFAFGEALPVPFEADTERGYEPHTCHNDTSHPSLTISRMDLRSRADPGPEKSGPGVTADQNLNCALR